MTAEIAFLPNRSRPRGPHYWRFTWDGLEDKLQEIQDVYRQVKAAHDAGEPEADANGGFFTGWVCVAMKHPEHAANDHVAAAADAHNRATVLFDQLVWDYNVEFDVVRKVMCEILNATPEELTNCDRLIAKARRECQRKGTLIA